MVVSWEFIVLTDESINIVPRAGVEFPGAPGYPDRAMKLIVQIPCLNEEATLPATIADIPRRIED